MILYALSENTAAGDVLKKYGLDGKLENPTQRRSQKGPADGPCVLVSDLDAKRVVYKPDEQTWIESIDKKYMLGVWNDQRPGPLELARDRQLRGHSVMLADGNNWLVPVIRAIDGGSRLPASLILGDKGQVVCLPEVGYSELSASTEALWRDFEIELGWTPETEKLTEAERLELCKLDAAARLILAAKVLNLNYRVGIDELNLLRLISTTNLSQILQAILDWPTFEVMEADKKKRTPLEPLEAVEIRTDP